jgi:hypothetical protein
MTLMTPTTLVKTRDGAQYEFTADKLHVRDASEKTWSELVAPASIELGFSMFQVLEGGGAFYTSNVTDILDLT